MIKGIFQIEKDFQKESTLENVLKYCQKYFDRIDKFTLKLRINKIRNPEDCQEVLTKLVGYYGVLKPIFALAETEKRNREVRYYNVEREKIEKKGKKKFSSAPMERRASEHVASYRRIRNIIEAYMDICERIIGVMQSKLKYLSEELKLER